jgi:hypothetical protein
MIDVRLSKPRPLRPLDRPAAFEGGILGERCERNRRNLFERIDVGALARVFVGTHGEGYAEPEFAGKYVDTAVALARGQGREEYLDRARTVVESIIKHQRRDGYLGTYRRGLEFASFSVWNQQFAIRALLAWHGATADSRALDAACRCADYLIREFTRRDGPDPSGRASGRDLLDAGNQGIQHSCILVDLARLFAATGRKRYLDFCLAIVDRWERSNLRLVSRAERWFSIGCVKAAEMLICYQGLVELSRVTGERAFLDAAAKYWETIRRSQIGITGNGSLAENWWMRGNRPTRLTNELLPNENCVAVCWMKLSAMLLEATGDARYADAFERTLLNHLLGSQAIDGSDFSYYQGLEGRKVHVTSRGAYSCCRYRGMNMLARLGQHVVYSGEAGAAVALYATSRARVTTAGGETEIAQETDYPRTGRVRIVVRPERDARFELRLRQPAWSPKATVRVNGERVAATLGADGFLRIVRRWRSAGDVCELDLAMPVETLRAVIDDRDCVAFLYGPLVLAAECRGTVPTCRDARTLFESIEIDSRRKPRPVALTRAEPMVQFTASAHPCSVTLVDYASAGSFDPARDRFRVWIPAAKRSKHT